MKIFITGCAKSGNTLLARLMHSFGLPVHSEEISLRDLCLSEVDNIVGKRHQYTIFSNILNRSDFEQQQQLIKDHNIIIINIYRNGRDVLESFMNDWGYWNPLIWMDSIRQMRYDSGLIALNVQYETLVTNPDLLQHQIRRILSIEPEFRFSEYVNKTPENLFPTDVERYKIRPISSSRINKEFDINRKGIDIDYFNETMQYLGYDLPQ